MFRVASAFFAGDVPPWFSQGEGANREWEVAVATVISTSNSPSQVNRNDDVRTVQYQFRDRGGTIVEGSSADSTLMLRDHSAMLVFYDSDDPTQHVAQCAAYYHVVAPGLDPDWLEDMG